MKYMFAYHKKDENKYLIKAIFDIKDGEKWAETTLAVFDYAKKNFADGEECNFEYEKTNGSYSISKILKLGQASQPKETVKSNSSTGFACENCGKELKDGSFKKCYNCNTAKKSAPATSEGHKCEDCGAIIKDPKYSKCFNCNKKNPSKKTYDKGANINDSIRKQAIGHATSRIVSAMLANLQGQIDDKSILILTKTYIAEVYQAIKIEVEK